MNGRRLPECGDPRDTPRPRRVPGRAGLSGIARCAVACLAAVLSAAACATTQKGSPPPRQDTVILLPQESGKTGSIVVSGTGGERTLSSPRQAVTVEPGGPPGEPFTMPEEQVRERIGPALSALPAPPVRYILYFRHDSTELTEASRKQVSEILRTIRERYPVDVTVAGHTDTVGDRQYNDQLALRRARMVAGLLVHAGVESSVLDVTSHGKDNPLVPTKDQVSEPRNRRVEVTVR